MLFLGPAELRGVNARTLEDLLGRTDLTVAYGDGDVRGLAAAALLFAAAALLIRSQGGDRLERAEFARLFASGEPQKGLGAFLAKERPSYSSPGEKP